MPVADQARSSESKDIMNRFTHRAAALVAALLMSLVTASSAHAALKITSFGGSATTPDGARLTQAGAHPDVTTTIEFETDPRELFPGYSTPVAKESAKNLMVDLPPGLVGAPAAFEQCTEEQLTGGTQAINNVCPVGSQVGTITPSGVFGAMGAIPLFNMKPPKGRVGMLAANISGAVVKLVPGVRAAGGYRITADATDVSQGLNLAAASVTLWGVPADQSHDGQRDGQQLASHTPRVPFISSPTSCTGAPVTTRLRGDSWETPGVFDAASFDHDFNGEPLVVTGCDKLAFDPELVVEPSTRQSRAPAGMDVTVAMPQGQNPDGLAAAHLKQAQVVLPEGMVVNPSSATGLGACSAAQIGLGSDDPETCPDNAKLGTVSLHTPLIDDTLTGDVYLAKPHDNPFDSLLALYLVARGPGVLVKLPGLVAADAKTGRLTVTFDDNPQLPFDRLTVSLNSGPRAALTVPSVCGAATTTATFTPWSGTAPVTTTSSFDPVGCGPKGFTPGFTGAATNPVGGSDSSFTLGFSRDDDDQELSGVSVDMPKGLLGRIAGVTQCAGAAAEAGTCGEGSRIGSVTTSAGAGATPFSLPGRAYLTGPYKGGPFGLSIVVPAVAGPFDLGTVVVRAAITVDPITAQLRVVSDPFPTILQGIPLQVRSVRVDVDRPGFMFNPTNCTATQITANLVSTSNTVAPVASRFQVGDCASLALKPSLGLSLSGKGQTTDGKHPAVSAVLTQAAGQANLKKVRVALPLSLALDPDNANGLCEFVDGSKAEPTCPKASIVGTAAAVTPILDEPLSGPVYFVKNIRKDAKSGREIRTLPKLVIPLVGQNGVKLTLTGTSAVENDQLVTTFDNIPDAPVSSFKLNINGGKGGVLVVSDADICKSTQIAEQQVDGQNNKQADTDVYIQTPSCALKVLSKTVGKTSVTIKVGGLGAGKVTVTGKGIRKTTKTIAKSTVATITAKRTKGTPGKVTVSYDPAGPAKARKTTK
jgi:hypothetical protein